MVEIDKTIKATTTAIKETEKLMSEGATEGRQPDVADQLLQDFEKTVKATNAIGKMLTPGWGKHSSGKSKEVQEDITI